MKNKRYISSALLLLFVVAFGCRLSVNFFCSCEQHTHHDHEHICCSCEHHHADCSHHDYAMKEGGCHFHFMIQEAVAQLPVELSKNYTPVFATILCYLFVDSAEELCSDSKLKFFDNHHFISDLWSGVPSSLRAPPVLV